MRPNPHSVPRSVVALRCAGFCVSAIVGTEVNLAASARRSAWVLHLPERGLSAFAVPGMHESSSGKATNFD